jgi:hypothetical protein
MTTAKAFDYGHGCSPTQDCTLHNIHCTYPKCAKGRREGMHGPTTGDAPRVATNWQMCAKHQGFSWPTTVIRSVQTVIRTACPVCNEAEYSGRAAEPKHAPLMKPMTPEELADTPETNAMKAKWSLKEGARNGPCSPEAHDIYALAESLERRLASCDKSLLRAQGAEADLANMLIRAEKAEAELARVKQNSAEAIAEIAAQRDKLKAHADAMAYLIEDGTNDPIWLAAVKTYRADFPKK